MKDLNSKLDQNTENPFGNSFVAKGKAPALLYRYTIYGLTIASEFSIPEFPVAELDGAPNILIRLASLPMPNLDTPEEGGVKWNRGDAVHFYWPKFGKFCVSKGREILIEPVSDADELSVRLPLLGCILGVLLHQRGLFTLHASTARIAGSAVAFIGEKGAGKSTVAAALHAKGHPLLTDDLLALNITNKKQVDALPGFPQLKLLPESIAALKITDEKLGLLLPQAEKRTYALSSGFQQNSLPLSRIYVLTRGDRVFTKKLSVRDSFLQLLTHSYAARFLGEMGAGTNHFLQCKVLTQAVPVYQLSRTDDISRLDDLSSLIEQNI